MIALDSFLMTIEWTIVGVFGLSGGDLGDCWPVVVVG